MQKSQQSQDLIRWQQDSGAQVFVVQVSPNSDFDAADTQVYRTRQPEFKPDFGFPGQEYFIRVTGYWDGKAGKPSEVLRYVVPMPQAVTQQSDENIEIQWQTSGEEFNVYWSTSDTLSPDNYVGVASITDNTSYVQAKTDLGLTGPVYYLVTAVTDAGEIPVTEVLAFDIESPPAKADQVATPTNVQATSTNSSVIVTWDQTGAEVSYDLYRQTDSVFDQSTAIKFEGVNSPFEDQEVEEGVPYFYWLIARSTDAQSEISAPSPVVQVKKPVTDDAGSDTDTPNLPPVILNELLFTVAENSQLIGQIIVEDPESQPIELRLVQDSDSKISLNDQNQLIFNELQDYDSLELKSVNHEYQVTLIADDGVNQTQETISIQLTDVDEAPILATVKELKVSENKSLIRNIAVYDPEQQPIEYQITGGADASRFTIDTQGDLLFTEAADYENPQDHDNNNVYEVELTFSDSKNSVPYSFTVEVTPFDDVPEFTSASNLTVTENSRFVVELAARDPDSEILTFEILDQANSLFSIENENQLVFQQAPDFESAVSQLLNHQYTLEVAVSDGVNLVKQELIIQLENVNEAPTIAINDPITIAENQIEIVLLQANDPESNDFVFDIVGGEDASLFGVEEGNLIFIDNPNYEVPADSDGDNLYFLTVSVTDALGATSSSDLQIQVTNKNEAPVFTLTSDLKVSENNSLVRKITVIDPEQKPVEYQISGGLDAALFTLDAEGQLSFKTVADFENPIDKNADNIYELEIAASDQLNQAKQVFAIEVTPVDDAPQFTSASDITVDENSRSVVELTAFDPDSENLSFEIIDQTNSLFSIENDNQLVFQQAPDYESAVSQLLNHQYSLEVTVTDGVNLVKQELTIHLADVNEAPTVTTNGEISISENQTEIVLLQANDPEDNEFIFNVTSGEDASLFQIEAGKLHFNDIPDYEVPLDSDGDNLYFLTVTVSDSLGATNSFDLQIHVKNLNEPPQFTSPNIVSVEEGINDLAILQLTANDAESDSADLHFAKTVSSVFDNSAFSVSNAGVVRFNNQPDFENPADRNVDNEYLLEVSVTDGINTSLRQITVRVTDINDTNSIPIISGSPPTSVSEGQLYRFVPTANDDDGDELTFNIINKPAWATFSSVTGELSGTPPYDAEGTYGGVTIYVSDNRGGEALLPAFSITVQNSDDHSNDFVDASLITGSQISGSIEQIGDVDYFKIPVNTVGNLTVYSSGSTNTLGTLYDSLTTALQSNNDSGSVNFSITESVVVDVYYLRVEHSSNGTGSYTIHIETFADEDRDGVTDNNDACPGTEAGSSVDTDGCSPQQLGLVDNNGEFAYVHSIGNDWSNNNDGDMIFDVATDSLGNVYQAGAFQGIVDFDPGPEVFELETTIDRLGEYFRHGYVVKTRADGSLAWVWNMEGWSKSIVRSVAVDPQGFVYIIGDFSYTADFDPDPNSAIERTAVFGTDIFIAKLSPTGELQWVQSFYGEGVEFGHQIQLDSQQNLYILGQVSNSPFDFDPGSGENFLDTTNSVGPFVTRINADGSYAWTNLPLIGASDGSLVLFQLVVDESGYITVPGRYSGDIELDPNDTNQGEESNLISISNTDSVVFRLDLDGNFQWVWTATGTAVDWAASVAIQNNEILVSGRASGEMDFDPLGAGDLQTASGLNSYLTRLSANGSHVNTRLLGGNTEAKRLVVDNLGNIYIAGEVENNTIFDPATGSDPYSTSFHGDVYLSKYTPAGNYLWTKVISGPSYIRVDDMVITAENNIYLTGNYYETADFDPSDAEKNVTSNGFGDIYLLLLSPFPENYSAVNY